MRTLLLAPHHDDEALFASFLCLRYKPLVVVVYASHSNGVPQHVRSSETVEALVQLGIPEFREWDFSDVTATAEEIEPWIWGLREVDDFDLVLAPAVEEDAPVLPHGHPQHNDVGRLADAVFSDTQVEHYTTYTMAPLTRTRSNREVVPEPEWLFRKHAALACYRSAAKTLSYRHFAEDLAEYLA